ncbi:hypothetical protein ACFPM0_03460 [Pseudonocardia sulfidoxydans]|uniref:hypothetical protein n=1 Tax=Pseudonocardia sulfidoxydans TaxID=54011 RepID=UPI0036189CBB
MARRCPSATPPTTAHTWCRNGGRADHARPGACRGVPAGPGGAADTRVRSRVRAGCRAFLRAASAGCG